jgi:hypothetical protein
MKLTVRHSLSFNQRFCSPTFTSEKRFLFHCCLLILSKDLTKVILTVQFLVVVGRFVPPFMLQLRLDRQAVMMLADPALECMTSRNTYSEIESRELRLQYGMVYMTKWELLVWQRIMCESYTRKLLLYLY